MTQYATEISNIRWLTPGAVEDSSSMWSDSMATEGWGLYSERLADEMGLYLSDEERFGALDMQGFRAARLIVDSGLHAFGWSRERAIELMHERGSMPLVRQRCYRYFEP